MNEEELQRGLHRDCVLQSMRRKHYKIQQELAFYDAGFKKIANLHEKSFYELTLCSAQFQLLVQCWKLGRDHVEFRVFTCNTLTLFKKNLISIDWSSNWETIPVDPKDAALYVDAEVKTCWYENLIKGKYPL